jgi:hypothetical protein
MYAVLDLYGTGLNLGQSHRITKADIVSSDRPNQVEYESCSSANPRHELGPQDTHGFRAAEVRRFDRSACQVAHPERPSGRTPGEPR